MEADSELSSILRKYLLFIRKYFGENICGREENDDKEKLHCDKGSVTNLADPLEALELEQS